MNRDNGGTEFNWQPNNRFNPFETISEAIKIFPEFIGNPEHNFYLGFFCLMVSSIVFNILVACKVIYLSEKEFLKDCQKTNLIKTDKGLNSNNSSSLNSSTAKITAFFLDRPFIVDKQQDAVKITFNKVSTYDLKANFGLFLFMLLFFLGAIYGLVIMVIFALLEYLNNAENSQQQIALLFAGSFQTLTFAVVAFFIWNPWLKAVFIKTVIEFNQNNIVVWEQAFGSRHKILSIPQSDLLELQEKQVNTQVPQVENTSLRIRYRRKNIELAGHLLPEAMNAVREIYDRYRNSNFDEFYDCTKELYLE